MNPWSVVEEFEKVVADYGGSPYGVAVDSCTNAIFLACVYNNVSKVCIPSYTYNGVAMSILNAGGSVEFSPYRWLGCYRLSPYPIYDSARRFRRNMVKEIEIYEEASLMTEGGEYLIDLTRDNYYYCLSFQIWKHLNLGRGGMILTNDKRFVSWGQKARFDGRSPGVPPKEDTFIRGWHMTMEPEYALRGLRLMEKVKDEYPDTYDENYPDLSKQEIFKCQK